MVNATARVVVSSASVVWFAAIAPHSADLREAGLLDEGDGRVKVLPGVEMTVSGEGQTAFIIEMALDRRQRCSVSGAAGNGLGTMTKHRRGAAGIGLGTTTKNLYLRRSVSGTAGKAWASRPSIP
jgi:hypothetical protein